MYCQVCNEPVKKITAKFCSTKCKNESQKGKREPLDPTKCIKCKLDEKILDDYLNRSGSLTLYSKNFLQKKFDWNDWEIIDKPEDLTQRWNCPHCDWNGKSENGLDGGGWIGNHLLKKHGKTKIDHVNEFPNDSILWPNSLKKAQRILKIQTNEDNRIQCLECNEFFIKISNSHLKNKHNLTMEAYKKLHPHARVTCSELSDRTRELYFSNAGLSKISPESSGEIELRNFIQSLGFKTIKLQTGFSEIDVFVEELKIGFEYHGLFYHSQFRGKHRKHKHLDDLKFAEERGIQLIQIFEDEWLKKNEIVKSRIRNILQVDSVKLYARKCEVRMLTTKEIKTFLDENHLQGYKYAKYNIGLVFNDEVVQCMTFIDINKRTNGNKIYSEGIYENVRSCTKMNHNVIGGFERMLKFFEDSVDPNQIVSFADRRWSSLLRDPFYIRLGFKFIQNTGSSFWVMKGYTKRMYRSGFTKPKMRLMNEELFKDFNDSELTQERMLEMLGFDIIWDCGNLKFIKDYNNTAEIPIIDEFEEILETENIVKDSRKRHPVHSSELSPAHIKCQLCGDYYYRKGFATHLGREHKIKNFEYVEKFGEYRPSLLKKLNK